MTNIDTAERTITGMSETYPLDEAQLAAMAFLARYSGRTLDAYRHDLRNLFQWAADHRLAVLEATRAHLEVYRSSMEERGLAASTIDRRLSTACGFYRFAHIDGRISSNPAQYVRRPTVHPAERRGLDRGELGRFLFTAERFDHAHAALAVLLGLNGLRVSEACASNIEDMGFERGHRVLRIIGKGNKPALIPLVPRTARTIDLAVGERRDGPILLRHDGKRLDRRTAHRWVRSIGKRATTRTGASAHAPRGVHHGRSRRRRTAPRGSSGRPARRSEPQRCMTGAARTSIATPPTSWSPSSPAADRRQGSNRLAQLLLTASAHPRHIGDADARGRMARSGTVRIGRPRDLNRRSVARPTSGAEPDVDELEL